MDTKSEVKDEMVVLYHNGVVPPCDNSITNFEIENR